MNTDKSGNTFARIVSIVVQVTMLAVMLPLSRPAAAADPIDTILTSYQPVITESIDASGLKHPGVGFTKDMLENMRAQVLAKKEPWNTHFNMMLTSGTAGRNVGPSNVSSTDPTQPKFLGLDGSTEGAFKADALRAYTQAILYYVTGDQVYRANAMRIIRLYAKMDPSKYVYYTDSHIHTGIPLQRMAGAAEILRYTSTTDPTLAWTDDDTQKFSANFVTPTIETFNNCNCRFMNQHLYTTIGKMSGSIFMGDRAGYDQAVEWFMVNKDAPDPAWTGSIERLFRLVTRNDATGEEIPPQIQHVEMGRDQAHGAGDLTNSEILARMMMSQGTKVDPVAGTPSTESNAVGPYEFLDDRLLAVHELWGKFMIGYDIPWVPVAMSVYPDGTIRAMYPSLSQAYRGRLTQNTWEAYYYYKYVRGIDLEQVAPDYVKILAKRTVYNWDGVDGGGDFWLAIPKAAEVEGGKYLRIPIVDPYREVEDRFTPLDGNSVAMTEGSDSFVRVTATSAGSKLAVYGYGNAATSIGFRVRTNGIANMDVYGVAVQLPDTKGQWRYVVAAKSLGDFLPLTITGNGTTVDIDHINIQAPTLLSPPAFTAGSTDLTVYTYAGSTLTTALDFSATDASALTYQVDNLPAGASFNTASGAFSWKPTQAGTYSFVVAASDGTTMSTRRVTIVVSTDRQAVVNTVTARYNPNTVYVTSTLSTYNAAYADMMNVIGTASDDVFFQKLATLRSATEGLQELVPMLADGSLNYANMFVSSDFGTAVPYLLDGDPYSFASQPQTFVMDFGPNFKVSVNAFQLKVRSSFPERIGGVIALGSNDKENWTQLTGETVANEELQTLPVADELKNNRYRFLKLTMIHPVSYQLFEPSEFRIFGARYEAVNKLSSVSLSSDQALRTRIIPGNTVKLSFKSTEAITGVTASIQGQAATVTTADNLNWTATLTVPASAPAGTVKFLINYKTAAGADAEPAQFTTDNSSLWISDQTGYIANLLSVTTPTDSNGRNATDLATVAGYLLDSNLSTGTDFRLNGSGNGGWIAFDFRAGGTVQLSRVEVLSRQDQYSTRINGTVVQGSNDYSTWTTISSAAVNSPDWQTLTIKDPTPYRYVRMYNAGAWFGNMNELRLYGKTDSTQKIASASISSAQALRTRIIPGNTVNLSFVAKEAINNVTATIQGTAATVATNDNVNFTATATLAQGVAAGPVKFAINYKTQDGRDGYPATAATDGSMLNLVDEADTIKNVTSITTLIDSTYNRSASTTLSIVNSLFDANVNTGSDFRIGTSNSGSGSYIEFDFRAGNQTTLTSVELLPRQDGYYGRINGTVVQGSNDNATWTNITPAAVSTVEWQTLPVSSQVPYRYIRITNVGGWFGNMNEVRFHGAVRPADIAAPVTTASAPEGTVNTNATVTFAVADNSSGVASTWYTVDGGTAQSGKSVTLTTEGTHTVSYWSVDWAGNAEQPKSVTVTIDKTPPVTATLAADITVPVNQNVTVTISYPADAVVKQYKIGADGTWTAYTAPVVVTENTTVYARSADAVGNFSAIVSYVVSNIDTTVPALAGLYADTTTPTNQNVTVTIYYPLDTTVQQYKIGDSGAWTAYTGPVVITDNTAVYARSADAAGNVSGIASYTVGNIYKVPPAGAVLAADVTVPTNGQVTVTIAYPTTNVVTKQYKVGDSGTWTAYAGPVVVADNATVYAQSVDVAGNVSPVTSYAVTNIDRVPPADAALSADITAPTNKDVTVTITYPGDAAVAEYQVGNDPNGGTWLPYGGPVVVSDNATVVARSKDAAGNLSNVTQYAVNTIDRTPPVSATLAVDSTAPTNQGVTVTIAYPGDAAVQEYRVGDSGDWTAYAGPVVVQEDSIVYARGADAVGNVSNVSSIVVSNIYKVVPITSATLNPAAPDGKNSWYASDVAVTLDVAPGNYGGAVTTEYKVNDGPWIPYAGSVAFGEGAYTLGFRSRDEAGNVEPNKSVTFNVDRTAPALSVQLDKPTVWPPNHQMVRINATLASSDGVAGVDSVVLTSITSNKPDSGQGDIQASFGTGATWFLVRAEKDRVYTVTYTATDKAGNKTAKTATVTVPHDESGVK